MPADPAATGRDHDLLRRAYEIARSAGKNGNHPFGALLARDGEILAEAENDVVVSRDVTRHAETYLVSLAARRLDPAALAASTLYTSTEPCLMCAGAIHWAGIRRVVYGASNVGMVRVLGETWHGIPVREALQRLGSGAEVVGPVLEAEGLRIHRECWPGR